VPELVKCHLQGLRAALRALAACLFNLLANKTIALKRFVVVPWRIHDKIP
jgi:hypothetical protein